MSGFFGVIFAGKPPVEVVAVSEREFACEIHDSSEINHVVVFMTGVQAFPEGLGGSVFIRWPTESGGSNWHYLGFICNNKPSAIFKVAQLHKSEANHSNVFGNGMVVSAHGSAQVGIIVESLSEIEQKQTEGETQASTKSTLAEFADKLLKNLINHTESFTVRLPSPEGGCQEYIPLTAFQSWYNSFSRRFQANPFFWRTLNTQ